MKAVAFANRMARDLDVTSLNEIPADIRQEMLDAINGGLQTMHSLAPSDSKITTGAIAIEAPLPITLEVTNGSPTIAGHSFSTDQLYRTIRINGDAIDNQITGTILLLHPYSGPSGTVDAVVYCDAVALPEPYEALNGDPRILETRTDLTHFKVRPTFITKQIGRPWCYHVEANAKNQNSPAPTVIRFDKLPDQSYRLECGFFMAPARIVFADLLSPAADIPLREELIEAYLLPLARAAMTTCRLWRDKSTKTRVLDAGEAAEMKFKTFTPTTSATPNNTVGTPYGF